MSKNALPDNHQQKHKMEELQSYINRESSEAVFRATSHKAGAKEARKKNKRKK
jgi:hypothetical protein